MNNNYGKFNINSALEQIIAGSMPYDSNIEFNGIKKTKKVFWLQNGTNRYFSDLPIKYLQLIKKHYSSNPKAIAFLQKVTNSFPRQLELYTYYMWGGLDNVPDISNGKLSEPENFRDNPNCPSLLWNKQLTIEGNALTEREIFITDMFSNDLKDSAIARELCITQSYLNELKKKLFNKVNVQTKTAYLFKASKFQVV